MMRTRESKNRRPSTFGSHRLSIGAIVTVLTALAILGGCEDRHLGIVDPTGSPPLIRAFRILPDSIALNTLTPTGGQYSISLFCQGQISDPDGLSSIRSVVADLIAPGGGDPILSISLSGDSTAGKVRYFSGQMQFSVTKTDIGAYHVQLRATDDRGLASNSIERRLLIWRNNAAPVLSNLIAPDTVFLPASDSLLIPMSVAVFDSNGLGDVQEVFFRSLDSSDPTKKYFLQDNGDLVNYGDQTAGDGIYSIIIKLYPTNAKKTYRFAFQALDASSDTSATLLHFMTVR
jgi:hypothetical protein